MPYLTWYQRKVVFDKFTAARGDTVVSTVDSLELSVRELSFKWDNVLYTSFMNKY